jgi:predicted 3-demethylubiquinone-9 3-methyltransferase (glyoxalase superfamily)
MATLSRITPCLWFDDQAEQAAELYIRLFPNSRITAITRYTQDGQEFHRKPVGSVMTVALELDGQGFTALNGGPIFKFTEAISFQVMCDSQAEVDHYWDGLTAGGNPKAQQCGWLKDRYGVSWQVVPRAFVDMVTSSDAAAVQRATLAMFKMKKLDLATLQRAFAGA